VLHQKKTNIRIIQTILVILLCPMLTRPRIALVRCTNPMQHPSEAAGPQAKEVAGIN
jgi:hypothetical protein